MPRARRTSYHDIIVGRFPDRHGFVRNVRNAGQQFAVTRITLFGDRCQRCDPFADFARHALQFGGVGAFFSQPGDLARLQILVRAQLLRFR